MSTDTSTRLDAPMGRLIDRDSPVTFAFEGRTFTGFHGDTVASALAANGQWTISRSFKYHRPRGILTLAGHDANTLVQVDHEPNVNADRAPITDGMQVSAQNVNGSLEHDRDAVLDRIGRFLPVGFYYRTFWGPTKNAFTRFWEPIIRKRSGLGKIHLDTPVEPYEKKFLHCDVLVVGGGPAGLAAALAAAEAGASTLLIDENAYLGGSTTYSRPGVADKQVADLAEQVRAHDAITVLSGATANAIYADNWVAVLHGNQLLKVRSRQVIVAAGSIEQPVVFRNNDLPGIMLSSAAQRLIRHYGVRPGSRAVVLTCNAHGYDAARDLADIGVEVVAVIDPRANPAETAEGFRTLTGSGIAEAGVAAGTDRVGWVDVRPVAGDSYADDRTSIACDTVIVSGGYVPACHLALHAGGRLKLQDDGSFQVDGIPEGLTLAGAANGILDDEAAVADGTRAGIQAASALGLTDATAEPVETSPSMNFNWPTTPHPKGRDFVDLDEDIQVKDLENTIAEGYREIELVKRFSTVGMGPSQGRHSALPAARIVARVTNRAVADVGVTTTRPPLSGEKLGALAGPRHTPFRRTPMHGRHIELGARMQPVGAWWRPSFYGSPDTFDVNVESEVAAVRHGVGMLDVSTLGSLEVRGPDAAELLNRLYTMKYDTQPVGRVRYAMLVNEMGSVIDDGVAFRIADDHYYVTSTTGAVSAVYRMMLFWNAQWRLNVDILNATAVFSGVNVTGPKARALLEKVDSDIDFGAENFGYLDGRLGHVSGLPVRVMRIGFTGELSYEVHTPYAYGEALWDVLMEAGQDVGLKPYGLEASRILRLEKGHIIIGQDTDAMTTPEEVAMEWAVSKRKDFYLGKRSVDQRKRNGSSRKLVGFEIAAKSDAVAESCLVLKQNVPVGFVTSTCWSPTLGKRIGLAYAGRNTEIGDDVTIRARDGSDAVAKAVSMHFFDPDNTRQEV